MWYNIIKKNMKNYRNENDMEKIINGEKLEVYELDEELRVRFKNRSMPLKLFEDLSAINPKFYELSIDEFEKLLWQLYPNGNICR